MQINREKEGYYLEYQDLRHDPKKTITKGD